MVSPFQNVLFLAFQLNNPITQHRCILELQHLGRFLHFFLQLEDDALHALLAIIISRHEHGFIILRVTFIRGVETQGALVCTGYGVRGDAVRLVEGLLQLAAAVLFLLLPAGLVRSAGAVFAPVAPGAGESALRRYASERLQKLSDALMMKRNSDLTAEDLFTGILHNRLGRVIVKEAGIKANTPIFHLYDDQLEDVISLAKGFAVTLTEPLGMDAAQVTAGGIVTSEFDPTTMESKLVPGLYACGEVLDVDGDCGGYNLQWAWSSGRLAGRSAGKE